MSNNNGGGGGLGGLLLLGLLLYVLFWIFVAIYALTTFWAVVLTLISLLAWNRPLRFFHLGITPYQAHGIVSFGIIGALLVPAFALFCQFMFEFRLPREIWFYLWTGGYGLGCVSFSREQTFSRRNADEYYREYCLPRPELEVLPAPEPKSLPAPFQYASWEDEKPVEELYEKPECKGCWMSPRDPNQPIFRR